MPSIDGKFQPECLPTEVVNKTQKCKDCGILLTQEMKSHVQPRIDDHKDLCCDCFDETLGMPPEKRNTPRPK